MGKLQKKLNKTADNSLIKALVNLASAEFSDSGTVGKIAGMLEDIRAQLVDNLNEAHEEEQKS